jgi:hypothetical protein
VDVAVLAGWLQEEGDRQAADAAAACGLRAGDAAALAFATAFCIASLMQRLGDE